MAGVAIGASLGLLAAELFERKPWSDWLRRFEASVAAPDTSALVLLVREGERARTEQFLLDAGGFVTSADVDIGLVERLREHIGAGTG
jgi:uncharacterized membrane protein